MAAGKAGEAAGAAETAAAADPLSADGAADTSTEVDAAAEPSLGSQVGKGAVWAVGANLTMRFASIAVTALLARLLSQDDFGVFAVSLAVYLVVSALAELGMASAVARSVKEPEDIAPTVASIAIIVGLVIGGVMAVTAPWLASILGQPAAAEPIRILSICVGLTGLFAVPGAQLVREFRQDRIFLATMVGFLASNPILVLMALHGGGAESFAWSRVIGQVAGGLVFWFSTSRRYLPGWRSGQVRALLAFGIPLSIANLVNFTLLNADFLILGRLVSAAEVGVYMIAFNVASWSTAILGSVLNSVVMPAFGRVSEDPPRLKAALLHACQLVGLVSLPVGALSVGLADPIVRTLFGEKWVESIPVLSVLAVYGVIYGFSLLFANVLVATGQTLRLLVVQAAWVIVLVPSMIGGLELWGLEGAAWAHVVTISLVALPAYLSTVVRATGVGVRSVAAASLRPLVGAVAGGVAAWGVALLLPLPWLQLIVGGFTGGVVYLMLAGKILVPYLPARAVPSWIPARWRTSPGTEVA